VNKKKDKSSRKEENYLKRELKTICKKVKGKKIIKENSEKVSKLINKENIPAADFFLYLKKATDGLVYLSETDSEVLPFIGGKYETDNLETLLKQINPASELRIKEINFENFFENLITIQDWFGLEEKETAEKFLKLKKLLEENLKNLKVFQIGEIEIEIYVVGLDKDNNLLGIKTEAVET
jgi:hypothetical protein